MEADGDTFVLNFLEKFTNSDFWDQRFVNIYLDTKTSKLTPFIDYGMSINLEKLSKLATNTSKYTHIV